MLDFAKARKNMVDCQIHPAGVIDLRILNAFEIMPREAFVPDASRQTSYHDEAIALGQGRFMLAPQTHARMIQIAAPRADDVVLDIGGTTGYPAAILSSMVTTVIALDDQQAWLDMASERWNMHEVVNVAGMLGPLREGCASCAPFSLIMINGAVAEVPSVLEQQIAPGGRLICVLQKSGEKMGRIVAVHKSAEGHVSTTVHSDATASYLHGFEPAHTFVF